MSRSPFRIQCGAWLLFLSYVIAVAQAQTDLRDETRTPASTLPSVSPSVAFSVPGDAVPTIHELVQTYRERPFAERCEVVVRRERTGHAPSERKASGIVRCDPRRDSAKLRLDLGDLVVLADAAQMVCVSAKDNRSFVAVPRRASMLASLAEGLPPLPFINLLLAFEQGLPDRTEVYPELSWSSEIQGQNMVFSARSGSTSIALVAGGTPLRLTESRVRRGAEDDTLEIRIVYTPMIYSEKDMALDLSGREAKRTIQELNMADAALSAPLGRIANIHGNTAEFKPWSLADALATRRAAAEGPQLVAVVMFAGPLGADARVISEEVANTMSGLRNAAAELRRSATDQPNTPRLGIEPLAVYDLSTFEREAPAKLAASWATASAGQAEGASLRWCLSPANTLEKYAKGSPLCILLVDTEMNLVGIVKPGADAATTQSQVLQLIREK